MKNVMIVDDNCLTAEGIEKNIDWSALDATVIAVEYNSLSALDILKDTHVDLIISDIEMPDLDGISMSQKALEIQPFIKVILVSAYDKFEYAKRAIRLCVYDYIEKPLDYHYLTYGKNQKCFYGYRPYTKKYGVGKSKPACYDRKILS